MGRIRVYGASDDLIEIEGFISEELDYNDEVVDFSCSDGSSGTISYDGNWIIDVTEKGTGFVKLVDSVEDEHTDEDALDCTSYSSVLVLDVEWIKIGKVRYF